MEVNDFEFLLIDVTFYPYEKLIFNGLILKTKKKIESGPAVKELSWQLLQNDSFKWSKNVHLQELLYIACVHDVVATLNQRQWPCNSIL